MHLILLHGYLLQGTGSNIYVASVAQAWRALGCAVTVICQERRAASLPFVDEVVLPGDPHPALPPAPGVLRVVVPEIDNLLPVYVLDRYEGYEVKTIQTMTAVEIERYIDLTAQVVRRVASAGADRLLANHVLLNPAIARRALSGTGVPYDVKVHGSALEYTLVPVPRLMPYAVEGLRAAERIYVGSRYVRDRVVSVFEAQRDDLGLEHRIHIVPPGMDPEIFCPGGDIVSLQRALLECVERKIRQHPDGRRSHPAPEPGAGDRAGEGHDGLENLDERLNADAASYDQRAPDADLPARWPTLAPDEPVICYFGKFLDAKGVGELVLAFPRILDRVPHARLLLIGFGTYREHLEGMIEAMAAGNTDAFCRYARAGNFVTAENLDAWLRPISAGEHARITVTGMLDHDALRYALPLASVVVVPSKRPEAFGMVVVEAMAAGVLPLCNDHSGLRDVIDAVAVADPGLARLMTIPFERFPEELPDRVCAALEFLYPRGYAVQNHRRAVGQRLREIAVRRFSWRGIAQRLIDPWGDTSPQGSVRRDGTSEPAA